MKLFKKKYTEKELIAFGNYLLSKERHNRIKYDTFRKVRPNYHDLKKEVHHADIENFKTYQKYKKVLEQNNNYCSKIFDLTQLD